MGGALIRRGPKFRRDGREDCEGHLAGLQHLFGVLGGGAFILGITTATSLRRQGRDGRRKEGGECIQPNGVVVPIDYRYAF